MSKCNIERRPAERDAICRGCDRTILKGHDMISWYTFRNRGQHIHLCLPCAGYAGELAYPSEDTNDHRE